jgi:hypothetical protein
MSYRSRAAYYAHLEHVYSRCDVCRIKGARHSTKDNRTLCKQCRATLKKERSMEQVTIIIDEDGAAEVSVQCVKGKRCQELTAQVERALGSKKADRPTAEMTEATHVTHRR